MANSMWSTLQIKSMKRPQKNQKLTAYGIHQKGLPVKKMWTNKDPTDQAGIVATELVVKTGEPARVTETAKIQMQINTAVSSPGAQAAITATTAAAPAAITAVAVIPIMAAVPATTTPATTASLGTMELKTRKKRIQPKAGVYKGHHYNKHIISLCCTNNAISSDTNKYIYQI